MIFLFNMYSFYYFKDIFGYILEYWNVYNVLYFVGKKCIVLLYNKRCIVLKVFKEKKIVIFYKSKFGNVF